MATVEWSGDIKTHNGAWYSGDNRDMTWKSSDSNSWKNTEKSINGKITKITCRFRVYQNLSSTVSGNCYVYNSSGTQIGKNNTGELTKSRGYVYISFDYPAGTDIGTLKITWNANVLLGRYWEGKVDVIYEYSPYYTLTINAGTGGTVTGGGTYTENTAVTIKASPNTGYKFTKWSDGNTSATRSVTVTGNATYTAYFEKLTYTVTATAGAGGTVSGGGTYEYGTSVTLAATSSEGYKFVQWSDGNTNATRTFTVTGNVSLTASFSSTNLNNIYVGTKQTSGVYIGTTKVKAVYVGTTKIYE